MVVFVATISLSHYIFHDIKLKDNKTRIYILNAKTKNLGGLNQGAQKVKLVLRLPNSLGTGQPLSGEWIMGLAERRAKREFGKGG